MKYILFTLFFSVNLLFSQNSEFNIYKKNEKYGLKDSLGSIVLKPKFDSIIVFDNYYRTKDAICFVFNKNKVGLINADYKFSIPLKYERMEYIGFKVETTYNVPKDNDNWLTPLKSFIVKKKNKFSIVDINNNKQTKKAYDSIFISNFEIDKIENLGLTFKETTPFDPYENELFSHLIVGVIENEYFIINPIKEIDKLVTNEKLKEELIKNNRVEYFQLKPNRNL